MKKNWISKIMLGCALFLSGTSEAAIHAFVTNQLSSSISVVDVATGTVIATIPTPDMCDPTGVAVMPDNSRAYVVEATGEVLVISVATNTILEEFEIGVLPLYIAILPNGTRAYVPNTNDDNVSVIDTATNTVIQTITAGDFPYGVAATPDGQSILVTSLANNQVVVINVATNTVVNTIPVGTSPILIAVTPNGQKAFVTNNGSNTVSVIDLQTLVVTTILVGGQPVGVAITPDGTTAFVVNSTDNTVSVIDVASETVINTIAVGNFPNGVAISPDGLLAYVANYGDDNVTVIDVASQTVTGTITVGDGPIAIAFTFFPNAPQDFAGKVINNRFALQTDRVNRLTWTASTDPTINSYLLLRDGQPLASIPATGPFVYEDHNRKKNVTYTYTLYAVSGNTQSDPQIVVLKG